MRDAVAMIAVLEGCGYRELMDLPMDEFLLVRSQVIKIVEDRKAAARKLGNV